MEGVLKEILHELKKMNHRQCECDKAITVTIGDDIITKKVIESINKQNRRFGKTTIKV